MLSTQYSTPDVIAALQDFVPLVLAIAGAAIGVQAWNQRRLRKLIIETTHPIQPDANGGKSLADLHNKQDRLAGQVDQVTEQVQRLTRAVERSTERADVRFEAMEQLTGRLARERAAILRDAVLDHDELAQILAAHLGVERAPSRLAAWIPDEEKR